MSDGSTIEWLDIPGTKPATWNPVRAIHLTSGKIGWYCEHVHEGCTNCYAERQNKGGARGGTQLPYKPGHRKDVEIYLDEKTLLQPLKWKSPRTIFVCSMTDLYGPWVKDEWLDKIKAVQALTPQHTYIELTKRPERMRDYLSNPDRERIVAGNTWSMLGTPKGSKIKHGGNWRKTFPLANCWGLVSCSTQEDADKFIPILLRTRLAIRGVSAEPLLGKVDFRCLGWQAAAGGGWCALNALEGHRYSNRVILEETPKLDWIIVGGESGRSARPMHPDWARSIKAQCEAAEVPMFFKQNGEYVVLPSDRERDREHIFLSRDWDFVRLGKKAAGRLLDGALHNGFPQARTT